MKDVFVWAEFDTLEEVMGCGARSPEKRKHEQFQRLVFEIFEQNQPTQGSNLDGGGKGLLNSSFAA